jgi:hypothetical protein
MVLIITPLFLYMLIGIKFGSNKFTTYKGFSEGGTTMGGVMIICLEA